MHNPISIIIINHNNKDIADVVAQCLEQMCDEDEIIIVNDDTNNINAIEDLKKKSTQIVSLYATEKIHNRSHNRNIGLKNAKNDLILLLDGDILIDRAALNLISDSFRNQAVVAVTGFTHLISYTVEQLDLLGVSPIDDYFELLTPQNSMSCTEILDYRTNYGDEKLNSNINWFYFFSCFLAIHRKRIPENIFFLEELSGWGAEDIEFAYQASLYGKLYFNRKINNIHIPHSRDHVKNLINNHKNLYILLQLHPVLDFEVLLTLSSPRESISRVLDMLDALTSSNINIDTGIFKQYHKNCLYTTLYSDGKSNIFIYGDDKKKYSLLGMAIPLSTQSVETAYIDGAIINYPTSIVSLILREHLRIAKHVYIVGQFRTNALTNNNEYFKTHIVSYFDFLNTHDLRMFQFSYTEDGLQVTSSLPKYEIYFDD